MANSLRNPQALGLESIYSDDRNILPVPFGQSIQGKSWRPKTLSWCSAIRNWWNHYCEKICERWGMGKHCDWLLLLTPIYNTEWLDSVNEYSIHTNVTESSIFWMSTCFVDSYRISKDYYKAMPIITLDLRCFMYHLMPLRKSLHACVNSCTYILYLLSLYLLEHTKALVITDSLPCQKWQCTH